MSRLPATTRRVFLRTAAGAGCLAASRGAAFGNVFYRAAGTQLAIGLAAFLALQLATPWIAADLLHDPTYAPYLRLAAVIPLFYGIRALYQGYLNGVRRFAAQAWIDIGASVSRMALVLGGSALGFGVYGAIGGFAAGWNRGVAVRRRGRRPRAPGAGAR